MTATEDCIMNIENNSFCWYGIETPVDAGTPFYAGVLGWNVTQEAGFPPTFVAPGGAVAHIQPPEAGPPSWCSFLAVDDVDARTARAVQYGATILVPPTDLPVGRFSVVATPSGGVFGLYQPAEQDELAAPGPGSIHWVELESADLDRDVAWFVSVFGFSVQVREMATGPVHVLEAGDTPRASIVPATEGSRFTAWVEVADLDATLARVGEHGGATLGDPASDPAVGRMAVVADPGGARFGLVQTV